MYKKILVPIDGSHTAGLGLREAIKLAKSQKARANLSLSDLLPNGSRLVEIAPAHAVPRQCFRPQVISSCWPPARKRPVQR